MPMFARSFVRFLKPTTFVSGSKFEFIAYGKNNIVQAFGFDV